MPSLNKQIALACTIFLLSFNLHAAPTTNDSFLAISDTHVNISNNKTIYYGQDTGSKLWDAAKAELSILIKQEKPSFIILLGDLPAHNDVSNHDKNIAAVLTGISDLNAISTNSIPVFYVFGNNDSIVENYGAFNDGTKNLFYLDAKHSSAATKGWPTLNANPDCTTSPLNACTYTTTTPMPSEHATDMVNADSNGYYSAYPLGSATPLRLIIINSVIYSRAYKGPSQLATAQAEMDWLAGQLADANKKGEAVYIAMHIPVGTDAFNYSKDMWNSTITLKDGKKLRDEFIALIAQYKTTVRTIMSGHTHLEELRAVYADKKSNSLSGMDIGVPGITPVHKNNPGFQQIFYDHSYDLTDIITYYTTPNSSSWNSYSFNANYACPNNGTIYSCVSNTIIPAIPGWKKNLQPTANNPYALKYPVESSAFDPTQGGLSSWSTILDTIQVAPIDS